VSNPFLLAALDFAARGWRVVPLHVRGKRPRPRDWVNEASADPDVVRGWWADVPAGNVGVALGSWSGLVAVDNDSAAGTRLLLEMSEGDLPPTCEMTTGKGSRLLYAIPDLLEFEPKTVASLKDEHGKEALRFQGRGGQCVMPPSVHPGDPAAGVPPGRLYAWLAGRSPADLDPAPLPAWLAEAMRPGAMRDEAHPERPSWSDAVPADVPREESFNHAADWWGHVLQPAGFTPSRPPRGDRGSFRYCRPGKADRSVSVTVGYYKARDGTDAMYVFSGSIPGLDAGKCYDKFGAFARLFFRGDFAAAVRAAAAKGIVKARAHRPRPRPTVGAARAVEHAGVSSLPAAWADDGYPDIGPLTAAEAVAWLECVGRADGELV